MPAVAGVALTRADAPELPRDDGREHEPADLLQRDVRRHHRVRRRLQLGARLAVGAQRASWRACACSGSRAAEISLILLGELAMLTVVALPVGAVIGYLLGQLIMAGFNNEVYRLSFVVSPATVAWSFLVVIAAAVRVRAGRPAAARSPGSGGGAEDAGVTGCCGCSTNRRVLGSRSPSSAACSRSRCGRPPCRSMSRVLAAGRSSSPSTRKGMTRVRDRFVVSAPVTGRVLRIELEPGDAVKRGEVVARVRAEAPPLLDARTRAEARRRSRARRAALGRARAEEQRARATLAQAERELTRGAELAEGRAHHAQELEAREAEVRVAEEALSRRRRSPCAPRPRSSSAPRRGSRRRRPILPAAS